MDFENEIKPTSIRATTTPVSEIMTKNVLSINLSDPLPKAEHMFRDHHIRHLPVINNRKLIGILSHNDIMRLSFGDVYGAEQDSADDALFNSLTIEQVMRSNPETVAPSDTIEKVAEHLLVHEFHALPVVEDEQTVGIISTSDVIRYLLKG